MGSILDNSILEKFLMQALNISIKLLVANQKVKVIAYYTKYETLSVVLKEQIIILNSSFPNL